MLTNYTMIRKDLYVTRNSDNLFNLRVLNSNGTPINLTGYTLSGQILEYELTAKNVPAIYTITNAVNGDYTIAIDDTAVLSKDRYVYNVYAINGVSKTKIQTGQMLVE